MTQSGTGKYERLLERCRGIAPIPTAVAYPCDESSLSGAIDAAGLGLIVPILVGPAATITEVAKSKGIDLGGVANRGRGNHPRLGGQGGGTGASGSGRAGDEGEPAFGRGAGRGHRQRDRTPHRPAPEPRVRHGCADVPQGPDRDRRGDQHRADARGQGGHLSERDRPGEDVRRRTAQGRDPRRGRNREFENARHARRRRALQDGGSRADQGRHAGRPARVRQRHQPRCREDEGHHVRGGRRSRHSAGAGSRGRQHDGQDAQLPGQRRQRRPGAGRQGAR